MAIENLHVPQPPQDFQRFFKLKIPEKSFEQSIYFLITLVLKHIIVNRSQGQLKSENIWKNGN